MGVLSETRVNFLKIFSSQASSDCNLNTGSDAAADLVLNPGSSHSGTETTLSSCNKNGSILRPSAPPVDSSASTLLCVARTRTKLQLRHQQPNDQQLQDQQPNDQRHNDRRLRRHKQQLHHN